MCRLKRICRYLQGRPREVIVMPWQERAPSIDVYVDSDFAGCQRTRKSSAGGVAMWGEHLIKSWAKTLPVIAMSSGEAELMSIVKGTTEALGLQAVLQDFGIEVSIDIRSDATAAIGMVGRLGLGKIRHLAVSDLWVQQCARDRRARYHKVGGKDNPSDAMTKAVDPATLHKHAEFMGAVVRTGRAEAAPRRRAR